MPFTKLALGTIKPLGWLNRQLKLSKTGLTGNIDKLWSDLSDESAWLFGNGEAWERGPYYLDGLISLAYLLEDDELIAKSAKWIDSILKSQNTDGSFGPKRTKDYWSRAVALKAVKAYHEATGDSRVIKFFELYFKYHIKELETRPHTMWAKARALEELIPLRYYKDITGDTKTADALYEKLAKTSANWERDFKKLDKTSRRVLPRRLINFGRKTFAPQDLKKKYGVTPIKEPGRLSALLFNSIPLVKALMRTHGVNVAMALKYPALKASFDTTVNADETITNAFNIIDKNHGFASGTFSADEHLDGFLPEKGVELCAVAELMFSLQNIIAYTENIEYGDRLELLAFNAFPATFTADMCSHQYLQQPNQISATIAKRDFFDVDDDATIFGLKPNFGCCAANMHQGFPKFTEHLVLKSTSGFVFPVYAPCLVDTTYNGQPFVFKEVTDYPFSNKIDIEFCAACGDNVSFIFRIPEYTLASFFYNGEFLRSVSFGKAEFELNIKSGDRVQIVFDNKLTRVLNPDNSVSYRIGTLLMSLSGNSVRTVYKGETPFTDSGFILTDKWNFAPVINGDEQISYAAVSDMPFDENAVSVKADVTAYEVVNWVQKKNSAPIPQQPIFSDKSIVTTLVPYGQTRVRISQFPVKPTK